MEAPLPGMNPYLEQAALWPDLHTALITHMRDQIQAQLSAQYIAVITPYVTLESIEIAPRRQAFIPDLALARSNEPEAQAGGVLIEHAPLTLPVAMNIPTRYARIEIRSVLHELLVTSIELLSPANKRPGADGADTYEAKRQALFQSDCHLLELDLLRAGQRPCVARPLPDAHYFIFLSRAYRRPLVEIWPFTMRQPVPVVPVPLSYPDPDIPLDLTPLLHQIYRNARYERRIDYQNPPPPPELSPADATWLDTRLRTAALRSE